MSRTFQIAANWLVVVLVITVNVLANALPINGLSTAEVSARYPNYFVPAGYTFGIWGLIYLLHILHAGYSTYVLVDERRANSAIGSLTQKLNPWFRVTCLLNSTWVLAWHHLQVGVSVAIILGLLVTLSVVFYIISQSEKTLALGYVEHVSLETPFIIYYAWIVVATIANITALLVHVGWDGGPLAPQTWSCVMIGVAALVGVWMSVKWRRPAFTAVVMWAVIGIYFNQKDNSPAIGYTALAACAACLLAAAAGFWSKRKLLFKKSGQHF